MYTCYYSTALFIIFPCICCFSIGPYVSVPGIGVLKEDTSVIERESSRFGPCSDESKYGNDCDWLRDGIYNSAAAPAAE